MPAFNAATAVEPLEWDFTAYAGPDAKGTVPEPTEKAVNVFRARLADVLGITAGAVDEAAVSARLAALSEEQQAELGKELADGIAELCQDSPTAEQVGKLPYRVQQAFFGWLMSSIVDPTGAGAASMRSPATSRNGA